MSLSMSVQTLQRRNTPKGTNYGNFADGTGEFPGANPEQMPGYLSRSEPSQHAGDGASQTRRREDKLERDIQKTVDEEDVGDKHKELITYFANNPKDMAYPYPRLDQDKWVLKSDDEESTFLHRIVKKNYGDMSESWMKGIYKIIPWVVARNPDLLTATEPNVFELASKKCVRVAYCMLNLLIDHKTHDILQRECNGTSCPVDVNHPLVGFMRETTQSRPGCPHQYRTELLEYHEKLSHKLQTAARQTQFNRPCLYNIIDGYCACPDRGAVEQLVRLSGADIITFTVGRSGQTLLHLAVTKFERPKEQDRDALDDLKKIIKTIVEVCPDALYVEDKNQRTAYGELLRYQKEQGSLTKGVAADLRKGVLETLKEACIGDTIAGHNGKINFLYPPGFNERKICLDLGSNRPIGKNYVKAITEQKFDTFLFESCLSYVSLPPRKHEKLSPGKREAQDNLSNYQVIFRFLENQGVKKIFKIIVDDLIGPPHSDKSIVELISKYHIEHWDWKKRDLSSDTILEAAPDVKTVVLHSSGNLSTLQGWACKYGLVRLQRLERVDVVIYKGLEDESSLQSYKDIFHQRLKRRFDKSLRQVKINIEIKDVAAANANHPNDSGLEDVTGRTRKNHDWLNHMDKFTEGMRNYEHGDVIPIVKVALIDDGIDPEITKFRVQEGRTFDENGDTGLDNYYVDPGRHGTIMGRLISKMCPNVQLYVARLKRSPGSDISASAAKEAVYWALRKNVDIISMSWTVPAKSSNTLDSEDFQGAIAEAVKHKKLLFCALRESEEALIAQGFYPVGLDQVFKIGSATRTGNLVKTHSGDERSVQFILPGLEVLLDHEEEIGTLNGSSVATALAAGLAALILFCADLVDQDTPNRNNERNRGQILRDISNMKKVFGIMSRESNQGKFPEVQKYFKISGRDPTIEDIKSLINSLMSGFS